VNTPPPGFVTLALRGEWPDVWGFSPFPLGLLFQPLLPELHLFMGPSHAKGRLAFGDEFGAGVAAVRIAAKGMDSSS